jgi:hypothetical protein
MVTLIFLLTAGLTDKEPRVPFGLMVEFIREPEGIKILDLEPELTWIVPARAGMQTAYHILVSSSRKNIINNNGDVWDSGKTMSSNSVEVETGIKLKADTEYFWKVRIWNERDKPSGYSGIQQFSTGNPKGYCSASNRFVYTIKEPQRIVRYSDRHFLFDFEKDAFGNLFLGIASEKNDTLLIHLGEKLTPDGKVDRNPGGSIRYQKVIHPVSPGVKKYFLNLLPDARNTGPSAVHLPDTLGVITPFRYAEIENYPGTFSPGEVKQRTVVYYFNDKSSSFTSSDTILNQVWDISKYSIKATSFAGIYVDGDRERIPYEADAYINQMGHYYTDREYSLGRISNEYFIHHPTWPTEWILHTVLMFYNDLMFTGNIESIAEYYDELKFKTLTSLSREDGLISSKYVNEEIMKTIGFTDPKERIRDIVDWPPSQKDTGWKLAGPDGERDGYDMVEINTVVNAFYYRNLILMSCISGILGNTNDSEFYRIKAQKVKGSFNDKLLDGEKGIYLDGENSQHSSLHANMMALAFDLVPAEYLKSVIDFIKSRGMACSVYGSQYLLEGLYKAGETGYAYSLLTSTGDRSWWNMIRSGSTITMEAWDMKYKPNSDWNHAWGAAPANIIPGYMWGISPAEPGFAKCIIRPQLGNLKHSKIKVPAIRGFIEAEFRDTGKLKEYIITIPGNMVCDFVNTDGKIIKLLPGLNKITFNNN